MPHFTLAIDCKEGLPRGSFVVLRLFPQPSFYPLTRESSHTGMEEQKSAPAALRTGLHTHLSVQGHGEVFLALSVTG